MFSDDHRFDASTRRKKDSHKEEVLAEFLDKYFYPKVSKRVIRTLNERDPQLKGIDTMFDYNGFNYVCDEKGATSERYYNKNLPNYRELRSYCLECYQLPKLSDEFIHGWFLNPSKETNSYLFVWITDAKGGLWKGYNDIYEVDCVLVRDSKIKSFLEKIHHLTREDIEEVCEELKTTDLTYTYKNNIKFNKLYKYAECPINMQVYKEDFIDISDLAVNIIAKDNKLKYTEYKRGVRYNI